MPAAQAFAGGKSYPFPGESRGEQIYGSRKNQRVYFSLPRSLSMASV